MGKIIFVLAFLGICSKGYCQDISKSFYLKIETIARAEKNASKLYKRLDSLKQTCEPKNSSIHTNFNRDIDFGYKHLQISITLNMSYAYHLNLLTLNDKIYLCSVLYGSMDYMSARDITSNKLQNHPWIDTKGAQKYLDLRNRFYNSAKNISDLKNELNLDKRYALNCGYANQKTTEAKEIEDLVKHHQINQLRIMLASISCEQQAYALTVFKMLKKSGTQISNADKKIITYLNNRKSALLECRGCVVGIFND